MANDTYRALGAFGTGLVSQLVQKKLGGYWGATSAALLGAIGYFGALGAARAETGAVAEGALAGGAAYVGAVAAEKIAAKMTPTAPPPSSFYVESYPRVAAAAPATPVPVILPPTGQRPYEEATYMARTGPGVFRQEVVEL